MLSAVLAEIEADRELWPDFIELCERGGRRAGTDSEQGGLQFSGQRLAAIGARVTHENVSYAGWRCREAALTLADGTQLVCNPLLGSQSTPRGGFTARICDLGRGAPDDFERCAESIAGRFVLVRHEYPFSPHHIHRRRKLAAAAERGAAGFIIASATPGNGPLAGSSGRGGGEGIPAIATDYESAARLASDGGLVALKVLGEDYPAETQVLTLELPAKRSGWVVLSAHLDGHDLAESAMDNATGVAVALAVARAVSPHIENCERGLRVCLFSAEEWALAGSKQYLDRMHESERRTIALNVNLDTVGGDSDLTALTSEFPRLETFVREAARESGVEIATYEPVMANSDHYNFACHGIPALRLVAGFDRPQSNVRHILTAGDTRDKVQRGELTQAARAATILVWNALQMSAHDAAMLRQRRTTAAPT
jgi:aminopeptidase YwaD